MTSEQQWDAAFDAAFCDGGPITFTVMDETIVWATDPYDATRARLTNPPGARNPHVHLSTAPVPPPPAAVDPGRYARRKFLCPCGAEIDSGRYCSEDCTPTGGTRAEGGVRWHPDLATAEPDLDELTLLAVWPVENGRHLRVLQVGPESELRAEVRLDDGHRYVGARIRLDDRAYDDAALRQLADSYLASLTTELDDPVQQQPAPRVPVPDEEEAQREARRWFLDTTVPARPHRDSRALDHVLHLLREDIARDRLPADIYGMLMEHAELHEPTVASRSCELCEAWRLVLSASWQPRRPVPSPLPWPVEHRTPNFFRINSA